MLNLNSWRLRRLETRPTLVKDRSKKKREKQRLVKVVWVLRFWLPAWPVMMGLESLFIFSLVPPGRCHDAISPVVPSKLWDLFFLLWCHLHSSPPSALLQLDHVSGISANWSHMSGIPQPEGFHFLLHKEPHCTRPGPDPPEGLKSGMEKRPWLLRGEDEVQAMNKLWELECSENRGKNVLHPIVDATLCVCV